jgi:hypothetical protein
MRGPTTKFVLDPSLLGLNDKDLAEAGAVPPMLGQELLYNLNIVVDMEQVLPFCVLPPLTFPPSSPLS